MLLASYLEADRLSYLWYQLDAGDGDTASFFYYGISFEKCGKYKKAIIYYKKALEIDDLAETFYQRQIQCLIHTGQRAEALVLSHHCKKKAFPSLRYRSLFKNKSPLSTIYSDWYIR